MAVLTAIPSALMPARQQRPSPQSLRHLWFAVAFLVYGLVSSPGVAAGNAVAADSGNSKEYQVKAAFLYNFIKFVEWPERRSVAEREAIVVGVLGKTALRGELEKVVQGRKVNGRKIVVSALDAPLPDYVDVIFVGAGEEGRLAGLLTSFPQGGILTVGETQAFSASGGMIVFTREADKVRFEIDVSAAQNSHLKISAQLQKLATIVRR